MIFWTRNIRILTVLQNFLRKIHFLFLRKLIFQHLKSIDKVYFIYDKISKSQLCTAFVYCRVFATPLYLLQHNHTHSGTHAAFNHLHRSYPLHDRFLWFTLYTLQQERSSFWWSGKRRLYLSMYNANNKNLKKKMLFNICVNCAIRRIKDL